MAGKQTGIIGLADVSAGQRDHVLPGARCARPGPIGLLDEDTDDALQGKPPIPVSSSQIRVKVTSDGTTPIPDLRCTVIVGSSAPTTVTTDKQGILVSSDKSPGSVTIAVPDKLIKISSDVTPTASLTISPQASVRGARQRFPLPRQVGLLLSKSLSGNTTSLILIRAILQPPPVRSRGQPARGLRLSTRSGAEFWWARERRARVSSLV
jgi:hypothetical protein